MNDAQKYQSIAQKEKGEYKKAMDAYMKTPEYKMFVGECWGRKWKKQTKRLSAQRDKILKQEGKKPKRSGKGAAATVLSGGSQTNKWKRVRGETRRGILQLTTNAINSEDSRDRPRRALLLSSCYGARQCPHLLTGVPGFQPRSVYSLEWMSEEQGCTKFFDLKIFEVEVSVKKKKNSKLQLLKTLQSRSRNSYVLGVKSELQSEKPFYEMCESRLAMQRTSNRRPRGPSPKSTPTSMLSTREFNKVCFFFFSLLFSEGFPRQQSQLLLSARLWLRWKKWGKVASLLDVWTLFNFRLEGNRGLWDPPDSVDDCRAQVVREMQCLCPVFLTLWAIFDSNSLSPSPFQRTCLPSRSPLFWSPSRQVAPLLCWRQPSKRPATSNSLYQNSLQASFPTARYAERDACRQSNNLIIGLPLQKLTSILLFYYIVKKFVRQTCKLRLTRHWTSVAFCNWLSNCDFFGENNSNAIWWTQLIHSSAIVCNGEGLHYRSANFNSISIPLQRHLQSSFIKHINHSFICLLVWRSKAHLRMPSLVSWICTLIHPVCSKGIQQHFQILGDYWDSNIQSSLPMSCHALMF